MVGHTHHVCARADCAYCAAGRDLSGRCAACEAEADRLYPPPPKRKVKGPYTDPFGVQSVVSLDAPGPGDPPLSFHDMIGDPLTEWRHKLRDWDPLRMWQAMMAAPYPTRRRKQRRRLSIRDFLVTQRANGELTCERCGIRWTRDRRGRGPLPRYCPDCRQKSRNSHAASYSTVVRGVRPHPLPHSSTLDDAA